MLRSSLYAAGALLLSASAFAQGNAAQKVRPVTSAVRDGGVFHVATGTWTRDSKSPIANLGPDTLYSNTCDTAAWTNLSSGETFVDSGRLPSTSSPDGPAGFFSVAGTSSTTYTINGFAIAYCAIGDATVDFNLGWYNCYAACSDVSATAPDVALNTGNMPGSGASGACWIITFDLENTTFEFSLSADCSGTWGGTGALDNFGWEMLDTSFVSSGTVGPFLAGDPIGILFGGPSGTGCVFGDSTVFRDTGLGEGTGLGSGDSFESDLGGVINACYFFGGYFSGNLYSSFFMEMYGQAPAGGDPTVGRCFCDAANAACGNPSVSGTSGCANSVGGGATITGSGSTSVAAQGSNPLVLHVTGARPDKSGVWLQGTAQAQSVFKDGNICVGGMTIRMPGFGCGNTLQLIDSAGNINTDDNPAGNPGQGFLILDSDTCKGGSIAADVAGSGSAVRDYQFWYRDGMGPCATGSNLSNGTTATWTP